jgi:hypothetical protein
MCHATDSQEANDMRELWTGLQISTPVQFNHVGLLALKMADTPTVAGGHVIKELLGVCVDSSLQEIILIPMH